jgi:hypothetical protein
MEPAIGRVCVDERAMPLNPTRYVSLPLVTRSANASIALTNARGVGDGRAEAANDGGLEDVDDVGEGRQPPTIDTARIAVARRGVS